MRSWQSISRFLWITILFAVQSPVYSQEADSTITAIPDSTTIVDSVAVAKVDPRDLAGFSWYLTGEDRESDRPAETSALSSITKLADLAPGFVFDLGTPGWPHGWSTYGQSPNTSSLDLDGRPFQQLLSHRPLVELLPLEWTSSPVYDATGNVARTSILAFSESRPYTEIRYLGGDDGLQTVSALHQQTKRKTWFGRPGDTQYVLGVAGRSADGEYPGSTSDVTQLLGRVRYRNQGWSVELNNLHSRSKTGAHGGVLPVLDLNSIFDTRIGQVSNSSRKRVLIRNDLSATLRFRLLGQSHPEMAVSAYWQAERFRTEQSLDTLEAVNGTFGVVAQQRVTRPDSRHRILVSLAATLDTLPFGNAILPQERERTALRATIEDSLLFDTFAARGLAGYVYVEGKGYPIGHLSGAVGREIKLFASATARVQSTSWMSREGWGDLITPGSPIAPSRVQLLEAGFKGKKSHLGFRTAAFFSIENDPVMLLQTTATDTLMFVQGTEAVEQLGVSVRIGLREDSERGFRASLSGTYFHRDGGSSSTYGERLNNQFPEFSGQARIGIRYLLFRGDLDLTVSVGGRAWTSLRSPVFHGPTGLFAVPLLENTSYGPSGYIDLNVKAVLRGATIFLVYENALSGLAYPGTFIVPLYPIANQRLRFGVLWPIWN